MSCRVLISISFCSISVSLGEDAITLPPRRAPGACLPDTGAVTPICLPVAPGPLGCPWRRCWRYFSHLYAQSSSVPLFSSTSPFPVAALFTEVAAASMDPRVPGAGGCGQHRLWPSAFSGGISQHGTPPRAAPRRGGGKSLWEASGLCYEYIFTFCLTMRQPATCPQERCPGVKPLHRNSLAPRAAPLGMCFVKE